MFVFKRELVGGHKHSDFVPVASGRLQSAVPMVERFFSAVSVSTVDEQVKLVCTKLGDISFPA